MASMGLTLKLGLLPSKSSDGVEAEVVGVAVEVALEVILALAVFVLV